MISKHLSTSLFTGLALLFGSSISARADYVFSFDNGTLSTSSTNTAIANYMDAVLGCVNCVSVNPGGGTVHVDTNYTGDGHVVGSVNSHTVTSVTLGDTNGATSNSSTAPGSHDYFLANTSDSSSSNTDRIVIQFSTPISGVFSFDYEIFPDGTCPSLSNCGKNQSNLPDLNFVALSGGTTLTSHDFTAVAPGGGNGSATHSPNSGYNGTELAPQLIGTFTTGYLSNVTELDFIDWPATIGIDNLKISQVPEPKGTALLMAGLLLVGLAGSKLRSVFARS